MLYVTREPTNISPINHKSCEDKPIYPKPCPLCSRNTSPGKLLIVSCFGGSMLSRVTHWKGYKRGIFLGHKWQQKIKHNLKLAIGIVIWPFCKAAFIHMHERMQT